MLPSQLDTRDAIEDGLAVALGIPVCAKHPKADEYIDRPLSALAHLHGAVVEAQRGSRDAPDAVVMGYGLSTSDFKNALASTTRRLAARRYEQFADHLALCSDQIVRNFKTVEFPDADVNLDLEKTPEIGEIRVAQIVQVAGQSAQLVAYGRTVGVSRWVFVNDDVGLLANLFAAVGTAAATTEAKMVAALLEGNPTLADGQAMFGASNIVAQALSLTSLDAAMKALRVQPTAAGNLANLMAAVLTVAPGLELSARTILKQGGVDDVRVVCLPWLADGRWYLQAAPAIAPAVGRLILRGETSPIDVRPVPAKQKFAYDGVLFRAIAHLGVVALSRIGIVRGGA